MIDQHVNAPFKMCVFFLSNQFLLSYTIVWKERHFCECAILPSTSLLKASLLTPPPNPHPTLHYLKLNKLKIMIGNHLLC